MQVLISRWEAGDWDSVYCGDEDQKGIQSYLGDVASNVTVDRFVAIGLLSGYLRKKDMCLFTDDCQILCNLVEAVVDYSKSDLETARNQLSDIGFTGQLIDDEVALLDHLARESWIDEARCIDDPWKSTQHLQSNTPEFILDEHHKQKGKDNVQI